MNKGNNPITILIILTPVLLIMGLLLALNYFKIISLPGIPTQNAMDSYKLPVDPASGSVSDAKIYYTFPTAQINDIQVVGSNTGMVNFVIPEDKSVSLPRMNIDEGTRILIGLENSSMPAKITDLKKGTLVRAMLIFDFKLKQWRVFDIYTLFDQGGATPNVKP